MPSSTSLIQSSILNMQQNIRKKLRAYTVTPALINPRLHHFFLATPKTQANANCPYSSSTNEQHQRPSTASRPRQINKLTSRQARRGGRRGEQYREEKKKARPGAFFPPPRRRRIKLRSRRISGKMIKPLSRSACSLAS